VDKVVQWTATSKREAEGKLATRVEAELDERFRYDVPVFLRSPTST
jgi:hypothetical protein